MSRPAVGGLLAAWPILGRQVIPLHIKTGLVVTFSSVVFPVIHLPALPNDPLTLSAGMIGDCLVG